MTCQRGHCTRCCPTQTPALGLWDRFIVAWGLATFVGSIVVCTLLVPESWGAWMWLFVLPVWLGAFSAPGLLHRRHVRRRAAGPAAYRKGKAA